VFKTIFFSFDDDEMRGMGRWWWWRGRPEDVDVTTAHLQDDDGI